MRHATFITAFALTLLHAFYADKAAAATVTVAGDANIFGAGHAIAPAPGGGGGGILPPGIDLNGATVVQFPSVTGLVSEGAEPHNPVNGPDGWDGLGDIQSVGGIAGIVGPRRMPLVGVFIGAAEPVDPAPVRLDFNVIGLDFPSLSPGLRQVFFIGDGRTSGGVLQDFIVPMGATRLFLGIADASSHVGPPGLYFDNQGAFTVEFSGVSAVPLPSAAMAGLVMLGMIGVGRAVTNRHARESAFLAN